MVVCPACLGEGTYEYIDDSYRCIVCDGSGEVNLDRYFAYDRENNFREDF